MVFLFNSGKTQTSLYSTQYFDSESGLPQNSVKEIVRDSIGYIWIGTEDGLVRFDGQKFTTYYKEELGSQSNRYDRFLRDDVSGGLYAVNHMQEFVNVYTQQKEEINGDSPMNSKYYRRFIDASKYYFYQQARGQPRYSLYWGVRALFVIPLSHHSFYVCYSDRIQYFENYQPMYEVPVFKFFNDRLFLLNKKLIFWDHQNQFKSVDEKGITPLTIDFDAEYSSLNLAEEDVNITWNLNQDNILMTVGDRLFLLEEVVGDRISAEYIMDIDRFAFGEIYTFYTSPKKDFIMLGSESQGMMYLRKRQFDFVRSNTGYSKSNIFYSQLQVDSNTLLTPNGDQFTWTDQNQWTHERFTTKSYGLRTIRQDTLGRFWVVDESKIVLLDNQYQRLWEWDLETRIDVFSEIEKGQMWVGTNGKGIFIVDVYHPEPKVSHFLRTADVINFERFSDSILYLGTEKGLIVLNTLTKKRRKIKGLENQVIRDVYVDQEDVLWIATYTSGIYSYANDSLVHYPMDNGLHMTSSHVFYEDESGFFWIPTNKGLFKIKKSDLNAYRIGEVDQVYYYYFDQLDGFASNEFNGGGMPNYQKLANGNVVFPSMKGLVYFTPSKIQEPMPQSDLYVDKVHLDQRSITPSDTLELEKSISNAKIELSSPFFGNPKNLHIYYALVKKGETPKWKWYQPELGIQENFNNPGTYYLHLKKVDGYGSNNETTKTLVILKSPKFHETIYFYLLLIGIIVSGTYGYSRWSSQKIIDRNKRLESEVEKRTKDLQVTLSELKLSQNSLKKQLHIQEYLFGAISHDVITPLKYVILLAKKIQKFDLESDSLLVVDINEAMEKSLNQIYQLMIDLVEFSKIRLKNESIATSTFGLHQTVIEIVDRFAIAIDDRNIEIRNLIYYDIVVRTNQDLLQIILNNIIDNSVKHTKNGAITIDYRKRKDHWYLIIEDQGGGMPQDVIDWINLPIGEQVKRNAQPGSFSGLGIFIVKELLDIIKGTMRVSQTEAGTRFIIQFNTLPVDQDHFIKKMTPSLT